MLWNGVRNNSDPNKYGQTMYYCRRLHTNGWSQFLLWPYTFVCLMYISMEFLHIFQTECEAFDNNTLFAHISLVFSDCEAFDNNTLFAHICLGLNYFELHFTTFFFHTCDRCICISWMHDATTFWDGWCLTGKLTSCILQLTANAGQTILISHHYHKILYFDDDT
jgi:hypothetical protein